MLDLEYTKTEGADWPISANAGKMAFTFSGHLETERIGRERLHNFLENLVNVLLWSLLFYLYFIRS